MLVYKIEILSPYVELYNISTDFSVTIYYKIFFRKRLWDVFRFIMCVICTFEIQ